jgi:RNA polymerase sigma-70 factor, ECF subfamily
MGKENNYEGVDEFAVRLIKRKVRRLVGQAGFREADRQDLEQELVLDVIERLSRFDPRRSKRETFITRLVEHHIASLIEARKAGVRDYRKEAGSLDELAPVGEGAGGDLPPILRGGDYVRRAISEARREEELRQLRVDLEGVVSRLPEGSRFDLLSLCRRLETKSVSGVAKELGVPRSTIYEAIQEVRAEFKRAGLDVYLRRTDRRRRLPVSRRRKGAARAPTSATE